MNATEMMRMKDFLKALECAFEDEAENNRLAAIVQKFYRLDKDEDWLRLLLEVFAERLTSETRKNPYGRCFHCNGPRIKNGNCRKRCRQ